MDDFDGFDAAGDGEDFDDGFGDDGPSSAFDDFDDAEAPDETDFDGFAFAEADTDPAEATGLDIEDAFDVDDDFGHDSADEVPADETAYAATYEDLLVADGDNPAAFPPELDMDVPEPVDGYPWVDLDTLGQTETEPWVNTAENSEFNTADVDGVVAEALGRFWEQ